MALVTGLSSSKNPTESSDVKSDRLRTRISAEDASTLDNEMPSIIELLDAKYIEEASKINLGNMGSIDPTDHIAMREWLKQYYMPLPKAPQIKRTRTIVPINIKTVPVTYGENTFSVRVYDPIDKEITLEHLRPALVMLHGGGWIHGYPEIDEDLSTFFASELRAVVIGVDYRLAPEYKFPVPANDCYETLNWISENAEDYKIDRTRVGIWGASAGGNLAASIALRDSAEHDISRIRHINLAAPATCHPALYPPELQSNNSSLNMRLSEGNSKDFYLAALKLWEKYAGDQFADPYASVLLAEPPANHPSVHITVAGSDRLRDEGIAYALKLRNAGIDTQLEIIPGVPHGLTISPTTPVASQFFRNQVRVLNCALNSDF